MIDKFNDQEIEKSVLLLGFAYASAMMTMIAWFAVQVGI